MAWIKTIPLQEADATLLKAYEDARADFPPEYRDRVPSLEHVEDETGGGGIVESHSLIPAALYHSFAAFSALMAPDLPLTRRQQEMINTTVSALNRCYY
jgi:hypothetical protein